MKRCKEILNWGSTRGLGSVQGEKKIVERVPSWMIEELHKITKDFYGQKYITLADFLRVVGDRKRLVQRQLGYKKTWLGWPVCHCYRNQVP